MGGLLWAAVPAAAKRFRVDFIFAGADLGDWLVPIEARAPGVYAHFAYFAQFLASGGL
jgi:hypothetical protein